MESLKILSQKLKWLPDLLEGVDLSNDNLHYIAISNLHDGERKIERWWANKYKVPLKPYKDHTVEELVIEMLEDHYESNPDEVAEFYKKLSASIIDDEYVHEFSEADKKWMERANRKVDLNRYRSEKTLTEEEEKKLLDNLGRNLPTKTGEFEDNF